MNQKELLIIFRKTDGKCFYCGSGEAFDVDHFFPRAKANEYGEELIGNLDILENRFLACQNCNSKKKDKFPEDFIENAWERYDWANIKAGIMPVFLTILSAFKT